MGKRKGKVQRRKIAQKREKKSITRELTVVEASATGAMRGKSGALTMRPSWISKNQLLQILQRTPAQHIKQRPGKGGGTWDYVTGTYVTKVLNYVFGWKWDFDIVSQEVVGLKEGYGQVITLAKLTVYGTKEGQRLVKTQYGRADVKYKKTSKEPLDLGNDYKASATDALKKCASMIGIASDVYGKEEFRDLGLAVKNGIPAGTIPTESANVSTASTKEVPKEKELICENCGTPVNKAVADYSKKFFKGRVFDRECQKLYKENNW